MTERPLKILFLAAEATPLAKVGGLADVAGSLPKALRALGHDVRLMIPRYGIIRSSQYHMEKIGDPFPIPLGHKQEHIHLIGTHLDDLPVLLVWNEHFFSSRDGVYGFDDDAQRFSVFGRAALAALPLLDWCPDVIHANDWHTALVPTWLDTAGKQDAFHKDIATLFTIHNLAYQGVSGRLILTFAQMEYVQHLPLEEPGTVNWMAQGIAHADVVTTVSERYAQEILTPELGMGLDSLLQEHKGKLFGVINGLDYEAWNPAADTAIPHRFDAESIGRRAANKIALQQQARLPVEPEVPLIGVVSRLTQVKGMELMKPVLEWLLNQEAQLVLLGTGQPGYHEMLDEMQDRHPQKMHAFLTFDDAMARRIYAGADMLLMPSAVEPCGLAQMIAMRYGCVPVVRAVGGLSDTVTDYTAMRRRGTGFTFKNFTPKACKGALQRALKAYANKKVWRGLQQRGMAADFSWSVSADRYVELYHKAIEWHGK